MFQTEIFFSGSETKGNGYYYFINCLKNPCSPFGIALRTGIIYRTETQTNEFLNFVRLFVIKMSSLSDFCDENNKNGRSQADIAN